MEESKKFYIRLASEEDARDLLEIYAPYVISDDLTKSSVSFEYFLPTVEEFRERIRHISTDYPYLVAELDGRPVGYAYAHPIVERAAYQWGAELTIYISEKAQYCGLGRRLYSVLEELLLHMGVITTYGCITASNDHSIGLHSAMGYKLVGTYVKGGFKKGKWLDVAWMAKDIQEHPEQPEVIKSFPKLDKCLIEEILAKANR